MNGTKTNIPVIAGKGAIKDGNPSIIISSSSNFVTDTKLPTSLDLRSNDAGVTESVSFLSCAVRSSGSVVY